MNRIICFAPLLCAVLSLRAQDFKALEQKVTEFTLSNGLRFVVVERHDAPVVSFATHVGAGTADDVPGMTGLAHFFERLWLKGTESIGTRDAAAEKKALDALEDAQGRLDVERAKGRRANDLEITRLELEVQRAQTAARNSANPDEFQTVLDENGAAGVASKVTADGTQFRMSLPSNRVELWFLLESQRISRPVFRDFYQERDAAIPGRRRESELPAAKALLTLASLAFAEHPYRNPAYGWPAEFAGLRHGDARQFFNRYFVPANISIGICGDIRPEEVRRLAEKYFGAIPARALPPPSRAEEPPQLGPRNAVIENSPEPVLAIGFKRPDQHDRDDPVLDVIRAILAGSRTSILAKELLETRRTAATVSVLSSYPGGRRPSLFTILVTAPPGKTAEENEKAASAILSRLQTEPVDEAALAKAKAHVRVALSRRFTDNLAIASTLAQYASEYGDWRAAFTGVDAAAKVTAGQVQLAAAKYFLPSRRSMVVAVSPAPAQAERPKGTAR